MEPSPRGHGSIYPLCHPVRGMLLLSPGLWGRQGVERDLNPGPPWILRTALPPLPLSQPPSQILLGFPGEQARGLILLPACLRSCSKPIWEKTESSKVLGSRGHSRKGAAASSRESVSRASAHSQTKEGAPRKQAGVCPAGPAALSWIGPCAQRQKSFLKRHQQAE